MSLYEPEEKVSLEQCPFLSGQWHVVLRHLLLMASPIGSSARRLSRRLNHDSTRRVLVTKHTILFGYHVYTTTTCYTKPFPKGPCAQIVYILAPKYLFRDYFTAKVYTIWVRGPLGYSNHSSPWIVISLHPKPQTSLRKECCGW